MLLLASIVVYAFVGDVTFAQNAKNTKNTEDTFFLAKKRGLLGRLGKSLAVSSPLNDGIVAKKNIDEFAAFKGKVINHIYVHNVSFGTSVNDTNYIKTNFLTDAANFLHTPTRNKAILNNLFFKVGDTLYPNLVADNVRYLRDLTFLQDARIVVNNSDTNSNNVEVSIFYKDVFSFGATGEVTDKNFSIDLNDDNLLGTSQRVSVQTYYDVERKVRQGFGGEYLYRNIKGTFFNAILGYNNISNSYSTGRREEQQFYSRIELPLVNPYSLWTGSFDFSKHTSTNLYNPDSIFKSDMQYSYNSYDAWAGYNISARDFQNETKERKEKRFIAVRITDRLFTDQPEKYKLTYNPQYADLISVLGTYTFFKQEYYRTNFLYGFGRNEDVPEGYNVTLTSGWTQKEKISRPYFGVDINKNLFDSHKEYFDYTLRFGGYYRNKSLEDVSMQGSMQTFTKLRRLGQTKWFCRHFLNGSISHQFNRSLDESLRLNSDYGIPQIGGDSSTIGTGRFSLDGLSVFFNTCKFTGFSFAPFMFGNFSFIKKDNASLFNGDGYTSIGGGIRTRNENLVFGTIELRFFYFPRTIGSMKSFSVTLTSDLQYKFNSQYIKRPSFISIN